MTVLYKEYKEKELLKKIKNDENNNDIDENKVMLKENTSDLRSTMFKHLEMMK